jgi:S-DNA-T family DNA segregation ATPase FtsK/SpoIIIE
MNADLQAYLRGPEPSSDGDHTSLLRQAMAETLRLSSAVVQPLESQIESDYRTVKQQAQERFTRDKAKLEAELQARGRETQQRHDARIEAIQADYEKRLSAIKIDARHGHSQASQKAEELKDKAQKEHQEQVMVAEFVAEGAVARVQQRRAEAQSEVRNAEAHLNALAAEADRLLWLYRQRAPQRSKKGGESDIAGAERPDEVYREQQALAERHLVRLARLFTPKLFAGGYPVLLIIGLLGACAILSAILPFFNVPYLSSFVAAAPVAVGLMIILAGLGGPALWRRAKRQVRREYNAFRDALDAARTALEQQHQLTLQNLEREALASQDQKEAELQKARDDLEAARTHALRQRDASLHKIEEQQRQALDQLRRERDEALQQADREYQQQQSALDHQRQEDSARIQARYARETAACEEEYRTSRRMLQERWDKGLAAVRAMLDDVAGLDRRAVSAWDDLLVKSWTPPATPLSAMRFGTFKLDLQSLADTVRARAGADLQPKEPVVLPALLEFPRRCSMLLQSPREGRQQAIETLRAVMMRLFTSLPPGRVRFTILDPVGLGESFAGFMHAGDYQEALVGGRIWTETLQIQQQLENLTAHMETVIQKYLRNEFETIEQYNEQAGELTEPYHFLVIADFPMNFNEESARRLSSIIHSGPRCGVHTLIAYDTRQDLPAGIDLADVSASSIHLMYERGHYVWQDQVLQEFPLALDRPPEETTLTRIMHIVGKAGAKAARVEVPFEAVAPGNGRYWSQDSREELCIPLGRTGATRLQYLRLGRGVAQHMLIAGKTGSGKSTLLHVMVTNLALWYSPDQVELYLIDFKQGVEFKTYVTHHLPHARAIAIESDREFGRSILQRLDAEMTYRGELFRSAGVQDIGAYRQSTGKTLPRTVLIVDEFQAFFGEDDKLAQDAAVLLEQLVRQGRAFGIHVVLGSQTLGGVFGLARSTIGQMAVRIALQCSEADSQLILDDDNVAARLLARPGEAIYNDVGGRVVGNSPFQTAWLSDTVRDSYLSRVSELMHGKTVPHEPAVVFEGNVLADIADNRELAECLDRKGRAAEAALPRIWLGAPVTMKPPTAVTLRRQSGANVLMVGQRDEVAMNLTGATLVSLAAQLPRKSAQFVILDGSSAESPQAGGLTRVAAALPHACRLVSWRDVPETIAELAKEAERRTQTGEHDAPTIILAIYGLQRYRMLRRSEDAFGLSLDEAAGPRPEVQFAQLLREGPGVGIHVLTWADTLATLERTLDRQTLREFDHRVLFQMSATDSSNLIDSPVANQLGLYRALLYSEEQGGIEKFRPYDTLRDDWLAAVRSKLAATHRT